MSGVKSISNRNARASNPRNKDAIQLLEEMVFTGVRKNSMGHDECLYCGGRSSFLGTQNHKPRCTILKAQAFLDKIK